MMHLLVIIGKYSNKYGLNVSQVFFLSALCTVIWVLYSLALHASVPLSNVLHVRGVCVFMIE